jgi:hypothetical protein
MKFAADRPFADPDKAARKLIEIANAVEAVQDGCIHIEKINEPFLRAGGSPTEYVAGLELAIAKRLALEARIRCPSEVHAGGGRYFLVSQGGGNDSSRSPSRCRGAVRWSP